MDILSIIFRFMHIASAVVAVGGTAFMAFCLSPAMRMVDDSFRETIMNLVNRRFAVVLWVSIAGLVISGVYNWVMLNDQYNAIGPVGHALIGSKVLVALILFALIGARHIGLLKLPVKVHLFIALNLAAIVILLGAILRALRSAS